MLILSTFVSKADEYNSESVFGKDYQCETIKISSLNHNVVGHTLEEYEEQTSFRLVHISNIPKAAILGMINPNFVEHIGDDEAQLRKEVEARQMEQEITADNIREKNSYFLLWERLDPDAAESYTNANACMTNMGKHQTSMSCLLIDRIENFEFIKDTGKFIYSNIGNWHKKDENISRPSVYGIGRCEAIENA